jgi:hypothetical protein
MKRDDITDEEFKHGIEDLVRAGIFKVSTDDDVSVIELTDEAMQLASTEKGREELFDRLRRFFSARN